MAHILDELSRPPVSQSGRPAGAQPQGSARLGPEPVPEHDHDYPLPTGTALASLIRLLQTQAKWVKDAMVSLTATLAPHHAQHDAGGTDAMVIDAGAATGSLRTLGSGAQQATAGNDFRLANARTPTGHHATHESGGSDVMAAQAPAAHHTSHEPGGGDALGDSTLTLRKLLLQDGITHVTSIDSPTGFTPTATVWTNFGAAVTITVDVQSKLLIWLDVTTSIAASGAQLQLRIVLDGGALTAVASAHSPGNGFYFCLPLLDFSGNCSAGAHTLQPQIWSGSAFALTFLGNGTLLRVIAVPSA
jgi:hypothetical protein